MNHRHYFDRVAANWDGIATAETLSRLGQIIAELDIPAGSAVLDAGTGTGVCIPFLLRAVGEEGRVLALDISGEMVRLARSKGFQGDVHFIQASVAAVPLKKGSLNLVVCNSCFPHFPDKLRALAELARALRRGGRLLICHTASRQAINSMHQGIGGLVKHDMIPPADVVRRMMAEAGLGDIVLRDEPDRYIAMGCKG